MPCRIGITSDVSTAKEYWESEISRLRGWDILGGPMSRDQAADIEASTAENYGCSASGCRIEAGARDAQWYIYHFFY